MSTFRLDRTKSWAGTKAQQDKRNAEYWKGKSKNERMAAAWYLTCRAYDIDPDNPPRMDKTAFKVRRRNK